MVPSTEQDAIVHLKKELARTWGGDLVLVQLFGSKARGIFHQDSDTDLLVVSRNLTEDKKNFLYDLVLSIVDTYSVYLSVKLFSAEEFERYKQIPTPFIRNVLREGIAV